MASQIYKNTTEEWHEKLLQCPYDPVHQIRSEKFSLHLIKCRRALKNHPTSPYYHKIKEYVICNWNDKHHIHRDLIDAHEKECPDNVNAIKIMQFERAERKGQVEKISNNVTPINQYNPLVDNDRDDDDDWDDDSYETYDPSKKAQNLNILPQGLTPAQRRDYRLARRHGDLPEFMKEGSEDNWDKYEPQPEKTKQTSVQKNANKPVGGNNSKSNAKNQKENKKVPNGDQVQEWTPPPVDDQFKKLNLADEDGFIQVKTGKGKGRGKNNGKSGARGK